MDDYIMPRRSRWHWEHTIPFGCFTVEADFGHNHINWKQLSANPSPYALAILKQNPEKIVWSALCGNRNPDAMKLLEVGLLDLTAADKFVLSGNPSALSLLKSHPNLIDWTALSANPAAITAMNGKLYLSELFHAVDLEWLLGSPDCGGGLGSPDRGGSHIQFNPSVVDLYVVDIEDLDMPRLAGMSNAMHLITADRLDAVNAWPALNDNPCNAAVALLEKHPQHIDWSRLSANPAAIHLLERNLEKIDWALLSSNVNAVGLLNAHPEKIYMVNTQICGNPAIFEPE